mgnify:CR=1 FL=1
MTTLQTLLESYFGRLRSCLRFKYWVFLIIPICAAISILSAYYLRFDFKVPNDIKESLWMILLFVTTVKLIGIYIFDFHTVSWRHTGLRSILIVVSYALACAVVIACSGYFFRQLRIPWGVVLIDMNFTLVWAGAILISARLFRELFMPFVSKNGPKKQSAVLIGAGDVANSVLCEINRNPNSIYTVKAIFDDNLDKKGLIIQGVRVIGSVDLIRQFVSKNSIDVILIAIASRTKSEMRDMYEKIKDLNVSIKTVPSLLELIDESRLVVEFRDINIEDLLGREEIVVRYREIDEMISNKNVMVTGAGGSIGSEICRQVLSRRPRKLILLERSENLLFHVHRNLSAKLGKNYPVELVPLLIDCRDPESVRSAFDKHMPNMVLHAAAHKHVPLQEDNPTECFRNNVGGIRSLVQLCHEFLVERFVLISTDKAVKPVNVMGASKRACELYTQAYSAISSTKFISVRFGNVLGSEGSVVPIFLDQIRKGGPVTVTHEEVTRYFMSIPEAVALVLQAAAIGDSGQIMMLDMGNPVKIVDLAKQLILLSGKSQQEIGVVFTGLRPGEKLFEELSCNWETCIPTSHKKIRIFRQIACQPEKTISMIDDLVQRAFENVNSFDALSALMKIVPEYKPAASSVHHLRSFDNLREYRQMVG